MIRFAFWVYPKGNPLYSYLRILPEIIMIAGGNKEF